MRLTLNVTSYTLVGGHDNPNCFSLASGDGDDVRVVNMKLGPFDRVVAKGLLTRDVEARLIAPRAAVLTDKRIPPHELHNDRWCTVCTPFALLPEDQQRAFLRTHTPALRNGGIAYWSCGSGVQNDDATVERLLAAVRTLPEHSA